MAATLLLHPLGLVCASASSAIEIIVTATTRIDDYGFKPYLERIESATKKLEEDITRIEGIVRKADNLAKYAFIASLIAIVVSLIPIVKELFFK